MKNSQEAIKITSDGTIYTLHTDEGLSTKFKASLEVYRASDIRFYDGYWRIYQITTFKNKKIENVIGHKHKKRAKAIKEEIKILTKQLR